MLPSNVMLTLGQLGLDGNGRLHEVAGFSGISFHPDGIMVGGAYSVHIDNNPMLSECRAQELARHYLDAGASPDTVIVMNNQPCAM